jgi:lipopolysaccharide/colanic/teichoic acid biosynthesis glycosyltransferase
LGQRRPAGRRVGLRAGSLRLVGDRATAGGAGAAGRATLVDCLGLALAAFGPADPTHKIKDDPRITRIVHYQRRYSLDELPQLVNVLQGDMSLVGPRIISSPELKQYGQWAMNLLTARPGLTGLWQVSGRSDISYEERGRLEMFYIRNYGIWLDVQLIVQTIPVVLSGRGAY